MAESVLLCPMIPLYECMGGRLGDCDGISAHPDWPRQAIDVQRYEIPRSQREVGTSIYSDEKIDDYAPEAFYVLKRSLVMISELLHDTNHAMLSNKSTAQP